MKKQVEENNALAGLCDAIRIATETRTGRGMRPGPWESQATTQHAAKGALAVALAPIHSVADVFRGPPSVATGEQQRQFRQMQSCPLAERFFSALISQGNESVRDFVIGFENAKTPEAREAYLQENYLPLWTELQWVPTVAEAPPDATGITRRTFLRGASGVVAAGAGAMTFRHLIQAIDAQNASEAPSLNRKGKEHDEVSERELREQREANHRKAGGHMCMAGAGAMLTGAALLTLRKEVQLTAREKIPELARQLTQALDVIFEDQTQAFTSAYASNAANFLRDQGHYRGFMHAARRELNDMLGSENRTSADKPRLAALMTLHMLDLDLGQHGTLHFIHHPPATTITLLDPPRRALSIAREFAEKAINAEEVSNQTLSPILQVALLALTPGTELTTHERNKLSSGNFGAILPQDSDTLSRVLTQIEGLVNTYRLRVEGAANVSR